MRSIAPFLGDPPRVIGVRVAPAVPGRARRQPPGQGGMRRLPLAAIAAMLLASAAGCASAEKSLQEKGLSPLTQKQLEERFSRPRKVSFQSATGVRGTASYMPDRTARVEAPNLTDTGTYRVQDGKLCFKWATIRKGEEACFSYYQTGPKELKSIAADGSLNATITDID